MKDKEKLTKCPLCKSTNLRWYQGVHNTKCSSCGALFTVPLSFEVKYKTK